MRVSTAEVTSAFFQKTAINNSVNVSGQLPSSSKNRLTHPAWAASTYGSFGYDAGCAHGRRQEGKQTASWWKSSMEATET